LGVDTKSHPLSIERLAARNPSATKDPITQNKIKIADQKENPMTMYELDKIIANLTALKESIQSNNDFLTEDFEGEMPETPIDEKAGVTTMFHNLIEDEL
jgi:hypothetical protein